MVTTEIPWQKIKVAKGQDFVIQIRVLEEDKVQLSADALAGATSLTVKPLDAALASGARLLFDENVVLTLSGAAVAGATTLAVGALPGPLAVGAIGRKIANITGYDIDLEVLTSRGDATPLITLQASVTDGPNGICQVTGVPADTSTLTPASLFWAAWRRDAGNVRPLAHGDFEIFEAGFL